MANSIDGSLVDRSYLTKGSTGNGVMDLQHSLSSMGYNTGPTDGMFGPTTEAAVKQFQKENNITVDGQVGPETRTSLDAVTAQMQGMLDKLKADSTPKAVSADPFVVPAAQPQPTNTGMTNDQLLAMLTNALKGSTPPAYTPPTNTLPDWVKNFQPFVAPQANVMSMNDALLQAAQILNPKYDVAQRQMEQNLKQDQESRGLFFSPLGAQLSSDKLVDFNADKQSAFNEYARGLVTQSQDQANKQIEQALAAWSANAGLASNLMSNDQNAQNNSFNQWLETQKLGSSTTSAAIDNISKVVNTMNNMSADKSAAVADALKRAEIFGTVTNETDAKILGVPVGTSTMDAKKINSSIATDSAARDTAAIDAALKRAEVTGLINNEADAKILGVPVGTTTQQARVINADLDAKQQAGELAKVDAALKRLDALGYVATDEDATLLGVPKGTNSLAAKTTAAQIKSMQLGDAINRANLTGTITNADDAALLGVKVGTSTLEARKFYLEQEAAKIDAAMKKVDEVGYVDKASAAILGIPVGTPTMAARQLAQQLRIAKMEDATQRAGQRSGSGATASKINQLMDVWKVTGYAPAGLESLGVKAGTPFTPVDTSKPTSKDITGIQKMFGVDSNTAEDIFLVQQSPTRAAALAELEAAKAAASSSNQSINYDAIKKAIDYKWPAPASSSGSQSPGGGGGGVGW